MPEWGIRERHEWNVGGLGFGTKETREIGVEYGESGWE